MSRIIFPAVMFTAIAAAAALVDYRSNADEMPTSHDIGVTQAVSAPGIVEGATEEIALSPEVSGTLVERLVSVGDHVQKGQPLLRLDDRTARLNVKAAEAELASAIAQRDRLVNGARPQEREEARALQRAAASRLALAMTSLTRIEQLESHRAVPEQEADDARSGVETLRADLAAANARVALIEAPAREDELRLADARVAAANAAVEAARVAFDKTTLTAPCDAQVLDIDAEIGELLTPASATSVAVLSDTRRLRVRAFVEELDAPRVTVGSKVTFIADGLPGRTFEGVVASLSPRMAAKQLFSGAPNEIYDTKTREVLVNVEDGEGLLIGLRVDVTLQLAGALPR
ncbi:HlyD family secretion protein [Posidoniimonas corsicana]|nr:HlyD family efflux transporter periplasmic adaptor subunit [Posidoniimonas corsicana]